MLWTHIRLLLLASLPALLLNACLSAEKKIYTPDEIAAEYDARLSTRMRDQVVIPFEIDDEIRQLARDVTKHASTESEKVRAIVQAIIGLAGFSISYDWLWV